MNFAFSLILVEVTGALLILLTFAGARRRFSAPEFLSLSFFAGAALAAYQLLSYYLLGINFDPRNIFFAPFILFLLFLAYYGLGSGRGSLGKFMSEAGYHQRWSLTERLLAAGIAVQLLWILFLVVPMPVYSHDAVANYALKAKIFHLAGGMPEGFFTWSETTVAHPDYPLLLPFLMTWIYAFSEFNDLAINIIMPAIYLAFLALFYSQLKKFFTRVYSLLIVFFLATIPQLADYATVIHADLLLTALVTCAFAYFLLYTRDLERNYLALSAILFGFSLWTKNEAVVFTGAFVMAFIALFFRIEPAGRKRVVIDMIILSAIIFIIAGPWLAVKAINNLTNSDIDFSLLTPQRLLQNIKDIPIFLNLFQQEMFGPKKWNIFWIIFFAAAIWKRKVLWKKESFYITLFIFLAAAGYFAAYMCTTGNNLYFYVNTTISRFMLHFSGVALLLLAYLMRDEVYDMKSFKERT